jgi:hypothetical protein
MGEMLVVQSRLDFPETFKRLGYTTGAEIGVAEGDFSIELVKAGGWLYLVDAWKHIGELDDVNNPSDQQQEERLQRVRDRFKQFPNVMILRGLSVEMAGNFHDEALDWVYLDADHREQSVLEDLKAWYPKVRVGGMLCGHDYFNSPGWEGHHGVKAAVDAFFTGREIGLTSEFQHEHSWFVIKE